MARARAKGNATTAGRKATSHEIAQSLERSTRVIRDKVRARATERRAKENDLRKDKRVMVNPIGIPKEIGGALNPKEKGKIKKEKAKAKEKEKATPKAREKVKPHRPYHNHHHRRPKRKSRNSENNSWLSEQVRHQMALRT